MKQLVMLSQKLQLTLTAKNIDDYCTQAQRQQPTYIEFITNILQREHEDKIAKRTKRKVKEAGFHILKTLESFDFAKSPTISEAKTRALFTGDYIRNAEPIIFVGDPGTGKTHLATALGFAAATQGYKVKFTTISQLATALIESKNNYQLSSLLKRYQSYHLLIIDELGYIPLSKTDAELIFQLISQRHEKYSVIITTNLSFGEWTSVFTDHILCKALIDRVTCRAHIIDTGIKSNRLEQTIALTGKKNIKEVTQQ